jgi:hypothetical protein
MYIFATSLPSYSSTFVAEQSTANFPPNFDKYAAPPCHIPTTDPRVDIFIDFMVGSLVSSND